MNWLKTVSLVLFFTISVNGQILDHSWKDVVRKSSDEWYAGDEAVKVAENVLLYQRDIGGWPKNQQIHKPLTSEKKQRLEKDKSKGIGATIDNNATSLEMLFLARLYIHHKGEKYREAFLKGLDYLLEAQYDSGGWPQFYPLRKGYYSHITYNDDAMANVMQLLKSIMENEYPYDQMAVSGKKKGQVAAAFQKGVNCILKTQYRQNGKLTGWCAQHDAKSYVPAKARSYELPSLSGMESAQLVELLMQIESPSPQVVKAVEAAVWWFKEAQLNDTRVERIYDDNHKLLAKNVFKAKDAPPIWARFMELDNNAPYFCDRDGIKKQQLSEIGEERRLGYRWYTDRPQKIIDRFPKWQERIKTQREFPKRDLYEITVAQDGSGHFTTIQEAINNAKAFPYKRVTIFVKNGIYHEKVKVHEWNTKVSLIGESKEKTIITYDDYFNKVGLGRNSTFYTYTLLVEADDFIAKNLTVENSSGEVGQAVALSVFSNRVAIINCRLLGNQDTLYASGTGTQYYKDCYIEGTTDFIFGKATTFFENCHIHSKKDSYITAASTPKGSKYGYVFKNCTLTAEEGVTKVYLGRPWRLHAQTVFLNCDMGRHILPQGWHNWSKSEAEKTAFYSEYENKGEGFQPEKRVKWARQLSKKEAKKYTKERVLGNKGNNWYANIE